VHPGLFCDGDDNGPTEVEAQLYIHALNEVNQKKKEITMSAYLRTWWMDPRLAYQPSSQGGCYDEPIILKSEFHNRLWDPNLYIDNLVAATWLKDLVYIYSDGRVWKSQQVLLTTNCRLQFVKLPFDSHDCDVVLASYSLGVDSVRLIAREGVVDTSPSGVGFVGRDITSVMWRVEEGPDFEVPGDVVTRGGWDYLHLRYQLERMPKFFIQQYMIPDFMFLIVVYMGFYVNPAAAPARAAVAVIPVLILRNLANSVFRSIPQISTNVWLCDYLLASMGLCCFCTVQFGLVQYALLREKPGADRSTALKAKKAVIQKCLEEAKRCGCSVSNLLDPEDRSDALAKVAKAAKQAIKSGKTKELNCIDSAPPPEAAKPETEPETETPRKAFASLITCCHTEHHEEHHEPIQVQVEIEKPDGTKIVVEQKVESTLTEADLTLVVYACNLFNKYAGPEGVIGPRRMAKVLRRFNLYFTPDQTELLMKKFMTDRGMDGDDEDDPDPKFQIDLVLDFLISVPDYLFAIPPPRQINPWSQHLPPSVQWDVLARWAFPISVFIKIILFFAILNVYPEGMSYS
jgi:hypothetical protein